MSKGDASFDELKLEFDKFVKQKCTTDGDFDEKNQNPDSGDKEDDEAVPAFVDEIADQMLAPAISGVYLSRIDIKRVAEAIDESLPIKERKKMIRALFRHTTTREYLRGAFDEFARHINGRVLIYQELSEAFPASKPVFDSFIAKSEKMSTLCDRIVEDFEEIDPTFEPMLT
ncbi:MAG: hypothetical protein GQ570_08715 [Helicobacteraceae bacterium]|nr:hypothetical protein [Helicobacteraceae bacterium]